MIDSNALRGLAKDDLLQGFSRLVDDDRQNTAALIAHIAEIDRRKLYLEHACASMFAFCTERFGMSEAIAHKRIRAGGDLAEAGCAEFDPGVASPEGNHASPVWGGFEPGAGA